MRINLPSEPFINLSTIKTDLGSYGVEAVQHIQEALREHNMTLMLTEKPNKFVVLGSFRLNNANSLERIIDGQYRGLRPSVIERINWYSNYSIQLIPIVSQDSSDRALSLNRLIKMICKLKELIFVSKSQC